MTKKPVVGPKPYNIDDAPVYGGRDQEIDDTIRMLLNNRISILLGESGVGKTSLIRAGVVPVLNKLRALRKDQTTEERRGPPPPPVVLLRDWHENEPGNEGFPETEDLFLRALGQALESDRHLDNTPLRKRYVDWWETRGEADESPLDEDQFVDAILHLVEDGSKLILIFDQFEELLRVGSGMKRQAIDRVYKIHQRAPDVSILLSLRVEHRGDLHPLERAVGGLSRRSVLLDRIPRKTVFQALQTAFKKCETDITLTAEAADIILDWAILYDELSETRSSRQTGETPQSPSNPDRPPNLLVTQAVALELYEHAEQEGRPSVNDDLVRSYLESLGYSMDAPVPFVQSTLGRWIEGSLEEGGVFPESFPGNSNAYLHLVKRLASQIADSLSSATFKVPQSEEDVMWEALKEELGPVGLRRDKIEPSEGPDDPTQIPDDEPRGFKESLLSGIASKYGLDYQGVHHCLLDATQDMLNRLSGDRNVIRQRTWGEGSNVIELVHDGLGPAFREWADDYRRSLYDKTASLTIIRGATISLNEFDASDLDDDFTFLRWNGCWITPDPPTSDNLVDLQNLKFDACHLRGTIFEKCRFENVTFSNCDLSGVLFRDCEFLDSAAGCNELDNCFGNGLAFIGCSFGDFHFQASEFNQLTITAPRLEGTIVFDERCKLTSSDFRALRSMGGNCIKFEEGVRGEFNSWGPGDDEFLHGHDDWVESGGADVETRFVPGDFRENARNNRSG